MWALSAGLVSDWNYLTWLFHSHHEEMFKELFNALIECDSEAKNKCMRISRQR